VRYDAGARQLELRIQPAGEATYRTEFIGTLRGVPTAGEEFARPAGAEGRYSRKYSGEIGKVLAVVEGLNPRYTLQGNELYVRAVVTSSLAPDNPSFAGQRRQAWTQPVGWSLEKDSAPAR